MLLCALPIPAQAELFEVLVLRIHLGLYPPEMKRINTRTVFLHRGNHHF